LDVAVEADATEGAETETEAAAEVDVDVAQAVEAEAEAEESGAADSGLSVEALQDMEFSNPSKFAPKPNAAPASAADKTKAKKGKGKAGEKAAKGKGKGKAKKAVKIAAAKKVKAAKPAAPRTHTLADGTKWTNCQVAGAKDAKGAGQTTLQSVVVKAAPPMREQSFVIEIDGTYSGPDVTYGSVTMQIARVSSNEPQAEELPELVYRHSVVLSDVLMYNPFTAQNPLSATMFVPESAFNRYAPAGEYTVSVVFTNQDKQPFACAKADFSLA